MAKKIKNLKLTTKTVSVETRKINFTISRELESDLTLSFNSDFWREEELSIIREEERQRKRKERQEKIKDIFDGEGDYI